MASDATDQPPEADDPLVERLRQGDADALAEYIRREQPRLVAVIGRQLSDRLRRKIEPEDILQEISSEAVRVLKSVDMTGKDPFGWLCDMSRRRIIDAHRRFFVSQKRSGDREVRLTGSSEGSGGGLADMIVASITSPSQAFSRKGRQLRLAAAVEDLPELQRDALRLRYVDGLRTDEVAEVLGKSHGAVRVMLSRTIKQLRDMLDIEES